MFLIDYRKNHIFFVANLDLEFFTISKHTAIPKDVFESTV